MKYQKNGIKEFQLPEFKRQHVQSGLYEKIGQFMTIKPNYFRPKSSEMVQMSLLAEKKNGKYFVSSGGNMLSLENFVEAKGMPEIEYFNPEMKSLVEEYLKRRLNYRKNREIKNRKVYI